MAPKLVSKPRSVPTPCPDDVCRSVDSDRAGYSRSEFFQSTEQSNGCKNDSPSSLFWKAMVGLLVFDLLGLGRDFPRLHRFVCGWKLSPEKVSRHAVDQVCIAVNYACTWYPRCIRCLQRSAITTCLMRHCGVPATMVLGAQLRPFRAHAWTEVDGLAVNERRDVQSHYQVLERF